MSSHALKGRRIAALAADGFEKSELMVPLKAYQQAGAKVDIISLKRGSIRGVNNHEPSGSIGVTKTVMEADPRDYDALLLPGGLISPDLLRQSAEAREFVRAFDRSDKPIASICHGPWVLASANLLRGRTLTSWPGVRDDMVNAGASWLNEEVVRDGNLVTSRSPKDLKAFVKASIELFCHKASTARSYASREEWQPMQSSQSQNQQLAQSSDAYRESAPQVNEPPEMAMRATSWMPSARTWLGIGAVVAAVFAAKGRLSNSTASSSSTSTPAARRKKKHAASSPSGVESGFSQSQEPEPLGIR